MYNEPDKANPYGMERPVSRMKQQSFNNYPAEQPAKVPYDQAKESNNYPAEQPAKGSPPYDQDNERNLGVIDSRVDSGRRRQVANKTLSTRRYEAQQEYGKRNSMSGILARKRGQSTPSAPPSGPVSGGY